MSGASDRPDAGEDCLPDALSTVVKSSASRPDAEVSRPSRYQLVRVLGQGGQGRVLAARDRDTGRVIALKTLRRTVAPEDEEWRTFQREVRITAQLEHPNIVPVHDVGVLPDGQPYYTMRVVEQRSLADVLRSPEMRAQWSLARLLGVFVQVCRALDYAHARGVAHGDVKPQNVLLGEFGEVYVADWGLATLTGSRAESMDLGEDDTLLDVKPRGGTPGYAAPELIEQDWEGIDPRSDLFSLGVVLYELLTSRAPFRRKTASETLAATLTDTPAPPHGQAPSVSLVLSDLCMSLLARRPQDRPSSAGSVAERVEEVLEGTKEAARRREEAARLCAEAAAPLREHEELERECARLEHVVREATTAIAGWEPADRKRALWSAEDSLAEAQRQSAIQLARAVELYTKAIGYDSEFQAAHEGLAALYWSRARRAEQDRRGASRAYYDALVTEHDRSGHYAALLAADGAFSLETVPVGARVIAQSWVEQDRVLVPGPARDLGVTPLAEVALSPGSYLLHITQDGFRPTRFPIDAKRGEHRAHRVVLRRDDEIGDGFVYVPGGTVPLGGDPDAIDPLPAQLVDVPSFAMAVHPVSLREYCAFLDELEQVDPEAAVRRAPHEEKGSEGYFAVRSGGHWVPHAKTMEGPIRERYPIDEGWLWRIPACGIDWFDARAYCRWLSQRTGSVVRLPTELEWEKAARGADARPFPWGDRFDPTFCHMRDSRPFPAQPEPSGGFAADESPYGVRDLAGSMREWVGDVLGQSTAAELDAEPEPSSDVERAETGWRMVRSGSWRTDSVWCRAASRGGVHAMSRGLGLGFRVVKELPPER